MTHSPEKTPHAKQTCYDLYVWVLFRCLNAHSGLLLSLQDVSQQSVYKLCTNHRWPPKVLWPILDLNLGHVQQPKPMASDFTNGDFRTSILSNGIGAARLGANSTARSQQSLGQSQLVKTSPREVRIFRILRRSR